MKRIKVNLNLDEQPVKELKKKLIDQDKSMSAWAREQVLKELKQGKSKEL